MVWAEPIGEKQERGKTQTPPTIQAWEIQRIMEFERMDLR